MAKKAQKRSTTKKAATKPAKAARRPASKPRTTVTAPAKSPVPAKRAAPPRPAPAPTGSTLGEQAEQLRDEILRSKLTHPDPWRYAPKARAWGERVQVLVMQTAASDSAATRRALEALAEEVRADRDFQEARRLF